jgi:hypothetical protein
MVTIKLSEVIVQPPEAAAEAFRAAALRQINALGISTEAVLSLGKRRTLRI